MPTTIVFSGGAELVVLEDPPAVIDELIKAEPFHKLTGKSKAPVFVVAEAIAYIRAGDSGPNWQQVG